LKSKQIVQESEKKDMDDDEDEDEEVEETFEKTSTPSKKKSAGELQRRVFSLYEENEEAVRNVVFEWLGTSVHSQGDLVLGVWFLPPFCTNTRSHTNTDTGILKLPRSSVVAWKKNEEAGGRAEVYFGTHDVPFSRGHQTEPPLRV